MEISVSFKIELTTKVLIVLAILVAVLGKVPYTYFTFLRFVVTFGAIYLIYSATLQKQVAQIIGLIGIAALFNPFYQVRFEREIWILIDYSVIGFLTVTSIYNWKKQ